MRIKRYVCTDMRQAIRRIRDEMGPDAVILANRKVPDGVEITAALDYDEAWLESGAGATPEARPAQASPPRASAPSSEVRAPSPPGPRRIGALERELASLRGLLERELSGLAWGELARRHPLRASVFRELMELGLARRLARDIAARVPEGNGIEGAGRMALGLLARRIPIAAADLLQSGGVVALLGPTGVGKTTTAAKLAARFSLAHGARRVALVTTDSFRVGAHEQLRTFAEIIGVPLRVVHDLDQLRAALEHFADRRLVLIDTAGMSQRDVRFSEQVRLVHSGSPEVRHYIVLSATAQYLALEEAVRAFAGARIGGAVITKVDEATSLGGALSIVCQHRIPVAYVTQGQRVPEDLARARASDLVARAVGLARAAGARCDEESVEMVYGGLKANARH